VIQLTTISVTLKFSYMTEQKNQQQQPQQGKNDYNKGQSGQNTPEAGKGNDPHKSDPNKMSKKQDAPDPDDEPETEGDFKPDKSTQIGDDPEQTKKKIPNMNK
jgi:hypothetical protein